MNCFLYSILDRLFYIILSSTFLYKLVFLYNLFFFCFFFVFYFFFCFFFFFFFFLKKKTTKIKNKKIYIKKQTYLSILLKNNIKKTVYNLEKIVQNTLTCKKR